MKTLWFENLYVDGQVLNNVAVLVAADGSVEEMRAGVSAPPEAVTYSGLALPGANNAHSHAFHRLLRGRTHADGGTFWTWRKVMYRAAEQLTPDNYYLLARAVYAEMLTAGYTSVAEFHYVHHQVGGTPYGGHDMGLALARAARDVGIRLVLLDTCYLTGGIGQELNEQQARFSDGSIDGYVERHAGLATALADDLGGAFGGHSTVGYSGSEDPLVTLGSAIHSVRGVAKPDLPAFAELDGPLHVHLSEQPAENEACVEHYGVTPTRLLADAGVVTDRLSAVHATHLTNEDIRLLGDARSAVVMCPTTEADLADGIGPASALAKAGAVISLGSDQHVVLDPLLELRALEAGERLGSGERGRFSPDELIAALTSGGAYSMHIRPGVGTGETQVADFVVVDTESVRTAGSVGEQAVLAATATDATHVIVGGREVAAHGQHAQLGDVAQLYGAALREFELD